MRRVLHHRFFSCERKQWFLFIKHIVHRYPAITPPAMNYLNRNTHPSSHGCHPALSLGGRRGVFVYSPSQLHCIVPRVPSPRHRDRPRLRYPFFPHASRRSANRSNSQPLSDIPFSNRRIQDVLLTSCFDERKQQSRLHFVIASGEISGSDVVFLYVIASATFRYSPSYRIVQDNKGH